MTETSIRVRCPKPLCEALAAVMPHGTGTISGETRAFWEWYTRQPGAKLPTRPPL